MHMSITGIYDVTVKTPVGEQHGSLLLHDDNGNLSGALTNPKGTTEFTGGSANDGAVEFTTRIRTPLGRLKAHVTGKVEGDAFTGLAELPLGNAEITGTRSAKAGEVDV